MRRLVAALLLVGCGSSKSPPRSIEGPVGPRTPSGPITPAALLTIDDLVARGAKVTKVNDHESLVCGDDCVCITDLGCMGTDCIALDDNLVTFKQALARDTHTVMCNLADTGRLCDLSYFRFDGDIHRYEIRYFGTDGRLIGQSNTTDYDEYCEGKAMRQFAGRMPDCAMKPWDVRILCGQDEYRGEAGSLVSPLRFVFTH